MYPEQKINWRFTLLFGGTLAVLLLFVIVDKPFPCPFDDNLYCTNFSWQGIISSIRGV